MRANIDREFLQQQIDYYGQPLAMRREQTVVAVSFGPPFLEFRGVDGDNIVPIERSSATYWIKSHRHKGKLGWDRGVLVDGGLFPHVLQETPND